MAVLLEHRAVWERKPTLARLYRNEFFSRMDTFAPPGRVIEVGAGPGFYKLHRPDVIALDVVRASWLDLCADCLALPFRASSVDAVVGLDVLHHLTDPVRFLIESRRVLRTGGRLVLVEPWNTPMSRFVYTHLHHEEFDLSWSPKAECDATGIAPFEGNQAIPFLVFGRHWPTIALEVTGLDLVHREEFSFLGYLLSCGFRRSNLLPSRAYGPVMRFEHRTARFWRRAAALRSLIVLERR
jgi:SAM-dependent methyltransferase